jgi:uncharacterized protein YndB with AHSA1/START domain
MMLFSTILTLALLAAQLPGASDVVVSEAVVAASVSDVWKAFTTRAGIESWMVANGDVDLRIGGLIRTSYQKGSDLDGDTAIHQQILSLDPERMLSYRVVKAPKDFPFAKQIGATWSTVYFESVDSSHTRVVARMLGYTSDPESQKMRAFFATGNKATMDALVKRFRGERD